MKNENTENTVDVNAGIDSPSVDDLLDFGMTEPKEIEPLASSTDDGEGTAPITDVKEDGIVQEETPVDQPSEEDSSPTADPALALMQKELAEAKATLAEMKANREVKQPEGSPKAQAAEDTTPEYIFDLPDQLVGMISSEDPNDVKTGITTLMAGVCRSVHKQILTEVTQNIAPYIMQTTIGQLQGQTQEQNTKKAIFDDFYGTYPQYNTAEYIPVVQATAGALATEMGISNYSPEFRNALGARLQKIFQPAQVNQAKPRVKPPVMMGRSGTRSTAPTIDDQQKAMMDMLSL